MKKRILYIGSSTGTSRQRSLAMSRLGHEVTCIDPHQAVPKRFKRWGFKTGYLGFSRLVQRYIYEKIRGDNFDVVWVDHGDLCSAALIRSLRSFKAPIVNYCQDNPYVPRDGFRWRLFLQAISEYDLIVTPRASNVQAAFAACARDVLRVKFAADEAVHRPMKISVEERSKFSSEVSFVGTWMPERGPFLLHLIRSGVPLTIFGPRWDKAPEFDAIKDHVRLGALSAEDYVKAVQCTSIAIGLLSKGNEDLHTTRSVEIPSIGTLLCAERTSEHIGMYKEDEEAVFWNDAEECTNKCLALIKDPARISTISRAGSARALRNGHFNERLIESVLLRLLNGSVQTRAESTHNYQSDSMRTSIE